MPFFRRIPLFQFLSEEEINLIQAISARVTYEPNFPLFKEGDPGEHMYLIESGSVKIYQVRGERERIITVLSEGACFGEFSIIDGKTRSAGATTLEKCALSMVSRARFLGLLRHHPDLSLKIMAQLCERVREANHQVNDLLFLDAQAKVLKRLLTLAEEREEHHLRVNLHMPVQELGKMVGLSAKLVNHVLHDLTRRGVITVVEQTIRIDVDQLK